MSIQDEIFKWVQEFDLWKQDLFRRASTSPELSDEDAREVAAILLGETREGGGPKEVTRDDLPGAQGAEDPMVIEALADFVNVNALAAGQTLKFEPVGLNIVFGKNGAGKTGYSRVLKHAGRTLYREAILTNQGEVGEEGPTAGIYFAIGGDKHEFILDLGVPAPALLGRICISDALAGEQYLTTETEVDYAPITLNSLRRLIKGLRKVESELGRRLQAVQPAPIDMEPYAAGTRVALFLVELSSTMSDERVIEISTLSEEEEAHRQSLRKKRGEIEARQAPQLRRNAEREAEAAAQLANALGLISKQLDSASVEDFRARQRAFAVAQEASALAAQAFEAEPVSGVGTDPWRLLWGAARDFAAHGGQVFPAAHDPAHCPLCMQELTAEARERLVGFDEFVKADVTKHLRETEAAVVQARASLPDLEAFRDRYTDTLARLGTEPGQPGRLITEWLEAAGVVRSRLKSGEFDGLTGVEAAPAKDVNEWADQRRAEAAEHAALERIDDQQKLQGELNELEARYELGRRRSDVLGHLAAMRQVEKIEEAKRKTAIGPVSSKITKLSKSLVEANLQSALNAQLEALDFQGLAVKAKPKTVEGTPMVGLSFETTNKVPLTDVLSQGEQRRLALAMFLAEMEVLSDASPVVFDDPSSSVDQEGRRHIARSFVNLARRRQLIVFTHELSFVHELRSHAPADLPIHIQHVRRRGSTAGYVHPSLPWEGLKAAQRTEPLIEKLKTLEELHKAGDEAQYRPALTDFCAMMRAAFERAVEERVLAEVVTRRSDTVRTTALSKVAWSEDICVLVDRGMDESSPWLHDQPLADGAGPPTPSELREGLEIYEELLAAVKAVNRTRESERQGPKSQLAAVDPISSGGDIKNADRRLRAIPLRSEPDTDQEATPKPA
ncbi:MAG TPA: hypothetical protein VK889_08170 [Solirubrobacterales bacterium]|nr:hypothetical protein [Solirubrobacterales bacterium]